MIKILETVDELKFYYKIAIRRQLANPFLLSLWFFEGGPHLHETTSLASRRTIAMAQEQARQQSEKNSPG